MAGNKMVLLRLNQFGFLSITLSPPGETSGMKATAAWWIRKARDFPFQDDPVLCSLLANFRNCGE
jgi:hypothetical protein